MVWLMDTYMNVGGSHDRSAVMRVVTGKTISSGGSYGRSEATGQGVVHCISEWAHDNSFKLDGCTFTVQGFGNVGSYCARILSKMGAVMVGVGDYKGYLANPEGINPHRLSEHVAKTGSVMGYKGGSPIAREQFFALECDLFIPAALELEIGPVEAESLKCKVVAEGANGPTHPKAEEILLKKGVHVIPDILANSGGVVVSYYEWLQNKRSERWDLDDVLDRLERKMRHTYANVRQFVRQSGTDWRTACYAVALQRLEQTYAERGIFP
jgi:glutamate dehydrogenase (NAD(P)+)